MQKAKEGNLIALIFPPQGDLCLPYLSLPSLTAYLRERGHKVVQLDWGIETFDRLLSRDFLELVSRKNQSTLETLSSKKQKSGEERRHLRSLAAAGNESESVLKHIEQSKLILRDQKLFFSPQKYSLACRITNHALGMISAAYFPTELLKNKTVFRGGLALDNIIKLSGDHQRNPFLEILSSLVADLISKNRLKLVGISVTYYSQIIGAFTVARLIKSLNRSLHICMGGAVISEGRRQISDDPRYLELADSYVFGEGEEALDFLASRCGEPAERHRGLPSNILLRGAASAHICNAGVDKRTLPMDRLPAPDFEGLPLGKYLSPHVVFPVSCSRGCYWRKCAFCSISVNSCGAFSGNSATRVEEELAGLMKKYSARYFYFTDNAVTPKHLSRIAGFFSSRSKDVGWTCMARLEKGLTLGLLKELRKGGCRQLLFGLESANQRVLDLMQKGTLMMGSQRIIKECHDAGIAVGLMNMAGFPTESEDELDETIDFLVRNKPLVYHAVLSLFTAREGSPVHKNPRGFGISHLRLKDRKDLCPTFSYSTEAGMTRRKARQKYEAGKKTLFEAYPWCGLFLDDAIHSLFYLSHTGYGGFRDFQESLLVYYFLPQKQILV